MTGLEPATSASQMQRSAKLNYIPQGLFLGLTAIFLPIKKKQPKKKSGHNMDHLGLEPKTDWL